MAILCECPFCHKKQSARNKICSCGMSLDKEKRNRKIKYWITYRMPDGRQRREMIGFLIEDARTADGKRRTQKKENRIFDMLPESKITFQELAEWYLGLEKVKSLTIFEEKKRSLNEFNTEYGYRIVLYIKPAELENFQEKLKSKGNKNKTIDNKMCHVQAMIAKGFDNDIISGETLKVFKKVKKLLKRNANARDRILTVNEFHALADALPAHTKPIFATGYYTGMRKSEILKLTWEKIDMKNRLIQLEAADTKDNEPRTIPVCNKLYAILKDIPRHLKDNHVFLYMGKPVTDIRDGLRTGCNAVDISYGRNAKDGFVFHDLRHTFNTNMRKAGVTESVIMAITGHSTREMFDRYNTIDADDTRQAIEKMQTFIANVDHPVDQELQNEK